jgi:hypothetical protein
VRNDEQAFLSLEEETTIEGYNRKGIIVNV